MHIFKPEKHNPQSLTIRAGLIKLNMFPGHVDLRIANINDNMAGLTKSIPIAVYIRCDRHSNEVKSVCRRCKEQRSKIVVVNIQCDRHGDDVAAGFKTVTK